MNKMNGSCSGKRPCGPSAWLLVIGYCLTVIGCQQTGRTHGNTDIPIDTATVSIEYAEGLKVTTHDGYRLIDISDPQKESKVYRFALLPKGDRPQDVPQDYTIVHTPVHSIICTTTLQLSGFLRLDALDCVKGINSSKRLFSDELKARIGDGRIQQIGKEGEFDEELALAINPEAILISLSKRGGLGKLADMDTPLIPYMGYQETSPLAQAEWIKLVGMLTGKTDEANEAFDDIVKRYEQARSLVGGVTERPRVLYGKMHGDNWYAMGGSSFISQIVNDAGGTYFISSDKRAGGVNLDFEEVYAQGQDCPYWVIQNKGHQAQQYESLRGEDARYADFQAFKEHRIICCETSLTPVNELSPMEPDVVLCDFIFAFHPDRLKDYSPKYYKLIQQ